jgi:hypothetical protein
MQNQWQCRWSQTLGGLEDTHQNVWGTKDYVNDVDPTVFFGLYGLPDFYALWRHKGRKAILWAGSDIRHFIAGYWLEDGGAIKMCPKGMAKWINKYCESYVENQIEYLALKFHGIESKIVPSFLGDVKEFPISFKPGNKLYTSVSGDAFELYGWDKIRPLALANPEIEFHLYGNNATSTEWINPNIVIHGRVPKEQMNEEIKEMQGALRLTDFDGFSEIIAKSIWMGQYPVSLLKYPQVFDVSEIKSILKQTEPNHKARNYYLSITNQYPWNQKHST